jgi:S1-C subfamily serine protease
MRTILLFLTLLVTGLVSGAGGTFAIVSLKPDLFRPAVVVMPNIPAPVVDLRPFVVEVSSQIEGQADRVHLGHGFAWDDRRIVTNAHVVRTTPSTDGVRVRLGDTWVTAARVVWSTGHDVAFIELAQPHGLPIADMRGTPSLEEGLFYYTLSEGRLLTGTLTASSEITIEGERFFTTSLPVRQGDSGGPVFDALGNVVGIATRAANVHQGVPPASYYLSAQLVRQVMIALINHR